MFLDNMPTHAKTAFVELQNLGCPVFVRGYWSGHFQISGEANSQEVWANYFDRDRPALDDFGVNHKINDVLAKHGLYHEWQNSVTLVVGDK